MWSPLWMLTALLGLIPSLMRLSLFIQVWLLLLLHLVLRLLMSPWGSLSSLMPLAGLVMIILSLTYTRSTRCDRMAGAKQPASYYDYRGFTRKRFSFKQRAAYWKKKYLALLKSRSR